MDNNPPTGPGPSKIQHTRPAFGAEEQSQDMHAPPLRPTPPPPPTPRSVDPSGEAPLPVAQSPVSFSKKITAFGADRRHEDEWARSPNTTGSGAIHVKTFHSKLTDDALGYMDRLINEWLDAHPQYEVKFVNSSIGTLTGKLKEPHLICQVWV